jgi:hypothetical protein
MNLISLAFKKTEAPATIANDMPKKAIQIV